MERKAIAAYIKTKKAGNWSDTKGSCCEPLSKDGTCENHDERFGESEMNLSICAKRIGDWGSWPKRCFRTENTRTNGGWGTIGGRAALWVSLPGGDIQETNSFYFFPVHSKRG